MVLIRPISDQEMKLYILKGNTSNRNGKKTLITVEIINAHRLENFRNEIEHANICDKLNLELSISDQSINYTIFLKIVCV